MPHGKTGLFETQMRRELARIKVGQGLAGESRRVPCYGALGGSPTL